MNTELTCPSCAAISGASRPGGSAIPCVTYRCPACGDEWSSPVAHVVQWVLVVLAFALLSIGLIGGNEWMLGAAHAALFAWLAIGAAIAVRDWRAER